VQARPAAIATPGIGLYPAAIVLQAADIRARGPASMNAPFNRLTLPALAIALAASALPASAAPSSDTVFLAPHRAIYDLKLARSGGGRGIDSVRGRIVYDFSGSACEGYALKFRQVSELGSPEGKSTLSDMRSTTWEDGAAKTFRFNSENLLDDQQTSAVDGYAERKSEAVAVNLSKPSRKTFTEPAETVFPTEHMRRIIAAARAGKTILELPVYDGSETGEKFYNTLTVIGHAIPPGAQPPDDAAAKVPALAKLTRWPVTISYFEQQSTAKERTGEQTPVYAISFELYENGISRKLLLDYTDFAISGEMTSLEMKKETPCK
jgi:hypothetical protein